MPRLLYVPILHSATEVGAITAAMASPACPIPTDQAQTHRASALREMWQGIQNKLEALNPPWDKIRIYQEALPVCGKEEQLVCRLATSGSLNHRLIVELLDKGGHLEGTEDHELLLREYDLLARALHTTDGKPCMSEYRSASETLLAERDRFIAQRLKQTLKDEETGLVFIGVRHKLDQLLKAEYQITYIIYRIPFQTVKEIYNV